MTGKSTKDKKLILVSNSVVNELMLIANKQGKPFYGFVTETLEHALKVYADGHSLEEVVSFYELMEIFKSLGAKMISDDMFNYLIVKEYEADKNVLQDKLYKFGRLCGKGLASRHNEPIGALEKFLSAAGWDLNEVSAAKENGKVKIRCVSSVLSIENTELLLKFIHGIMHEFDYENHKQDYVKGIISLEYEKRG
jgi:hypothetical protein